MRSATDPGAPGWGLALLALLAFACQEQGAIDGGAIGGGSVDEGVIDAEVDLAPVDPPEFFRLAHALDYSCQSYGRPPALLDSGASECSLPREDRSSEEDCYEWPQLHCGVVGEAEMAYCAPDYSVCCWSGGICGPCGWLECDAFTEREVRVGDEMRGVYYPDPDECGEAFTNAYLANLNACDPRCGEGPACPPGTPGHIPRGPDPTR